LEADARNKCIERVERVRGTRHPQTAIERLLADGALGPIDHGEHVVHVQVVPRAIRRATCRRRRRGRAPRDSRQITIMSRSRTRGLAPLRAKARDESAPLDEAHAQHRANDRQQSEERAKQEVRGHEEV